MNRLINIINTDDQPDILTELYYQKPEIKKPAKAKKIYK